MIKFVYTKKLKNKSLKKELFEKTVLFFSGKKINRFALANDRKLLSKESFFLKKTNNKNSKKIENNYNLIATLENYKNLNGVELKKLFNLPLTALFLTGIKINNTFFTKTRSFFQEKNLYTLKNNYEKISVAEQPFERMTLWSFRIPLK